MITFSEENTQELLLILKWAQNQTCNTSVRPAAKRMIEIIKEKQDELTKHSKG